MFDHITRNNTKDQLELIWNALESYRETCIPEAADPDNPSEEEKDYQSEWDNICMAMAWIEEDLNNDCHQMYMSLKSKRIMSLIEFKEDINALGECTEDINKLIPVIWESEKQDWRINIS